MHQQTAGLQSLGVTSDLPHESARTWNDGDRIGMSFSIVWYKCTAADLSILSAEPICRKVG